MSRKVHHAIYDLLSNDAPVVEKIGTRIYPSFLPEGVQFPAAIYRFTERNQIRTKDGPVGSNDNLLIEVYNDQANEVLEIADRIYTALDQYSGTAAGVTIRKIEYQGETDETLIPELKLFHLSQIYLVRIKL